MIPLLPKQLKAFDKHSSNKVGALFMKMGTGKTRVAVELVNQVENIDLVVWIAPLRSIKPKEESLLSIKDEVSKWGGFKAKEVIYIGVETIQSSDRQYLQLYKKIATTWKSFLIVDESIKIKNFDAKRTKRLIEFSKMVEYKLILNGEPITRDLLDLWSQFQFLDPETYDKLEQRLQGVHTASMYSKENLIYSIKKKKKNFKSWKEYKDFLLSSIHPDLKRMFDYQWSRFGYTDDVGACKYMVKRILLCDWEGNITWNRDNEFNYTKDQILHKNKLKREDEIVKKWTSLL